MECRILFAIHNDKDDVLALLNGVIDEFEEVLPILCDKNPTYIAFEVVSSEDHLNEQVSTRGSSCTSVDAFIYTVHRGDKKRWLIPIEWKFTVVFHRVCPEPSLGETLFPYHLPIHNLITN